MTYQSALEAAHRAHHRARLTRARTTSPHERARADAIHTLRLRELRAALEQQQAGAARIR